jgi:hypothetical protein
LVSTPPPVVGGTAAETSPALSSPSPGAPGTGSSAIIAEIISPPGRAIEPIGEPIQVYGAIENAQPNHHLTLFVQYEGANTFYAVDADVIIQGENWLGSINLTEPGRVTLWLVDLSPEAIQALNQMINKQGSGLTTLKFSPGVTVLGQIAFSAY